jgi:hypothetical protein
VKRGVYILPANKTFMVSESTWQLLACYKMFRPQTFMVKLGTRKLVAIADIFPWPPGTEQNLFDIPDKLVRRLVDRPMKLGKKVIANTCQLCYDGKT